MKNIIVVGGGPCGIMASYQIKKNNPNYQVYLIDRTSIGKRIKVSGNGRCNFSNDNIDFTMYHNGDLINDILLDFKNYENEFYKEINLHYYSDEEGRRYPLTDSSKTVLNTLINALNKVGVIIKENEEFINLVKNNDSYLLKTSIDEYNVEQVVFCIGGISQLYQKDNYLNVINNIPYELNINQLRPSLCPIKVQESINKNVVGKRASAIVSVKYFNEVVYQEKGEIIFKKDGVSGIVIFNISSFLSSKKDLINYQLSFNFIDGINESTINNELINFTKEEVVSAYVVDEIKDLIISRYQNIYQGLSDFRLKVKELYSFNDSQVTRGGLCLDDIDISTLSLKIDNNIYFGGEMIDVDAKCGGYNIFFALASGYRVGKSVK